jgi:hypothetical protein
MGEPHLPNNEPQQPQQPQP